MLKDFDILVMAAQPWEALTCVTVSAELILVSGFERQAQSVCPSVS